jgi:class 3 adenylate cyclase
LLAEVKRDEVFEFLPVILMMDGNHADRRKAYFPLGVEHFMDPACAPDEMVRACLVALRYKLQLDTVMERLRVVTEENITRAIQLDILQKFLPQTVWDSSRSLAQEQDFEIPEIEAELAIVFADIQSFTSRAELLAPSAVIRMLNTVFPVATRSVYSHGGDIDKFIGDAFVAVFPAVAPALAAALQIQSELAVLVPEDGSPALRLRIGIHYGRVVRGSVGGDSRWDHTLIGDVVNTTQRLESNAPAGGVMVSRTALQATGRVLAPALRFETYTLKGKGTKLEAAVLFPGDSAFA